MIAPYLYDWDLELIEVERSGKKHQEISPSGIGMILDKAEELQKGVTAMPLRDRLDVIDAMGRKWKERLDQGDLAQLQTDLVRSTGYSTALIDLEMSFVPAVLSRKNMERNLNSSLIGGMRALDGFAPVGEGEGIMHRPAGPSFIISSGNSIVPTLIPTTISWATGNLTLLKPSVSNYSGVVEVLRTIEQLPDSPVVQMMRRTLLISYFAPEGASMEHILNQGRFGVINFWGGEPARTVVAQKVASNPHHPRFFANGPMTGVALIEAEMANNEVAEGLALNVLLYDQQLCSSPTLCIFIGESSAATEFARSVARNLDEMGAGYDSILSEGQMFALQNARRTLQMRGAMVLAGKNIANQWTISLTKEKGSLDEVLSQCGSVHLYNRRRFLEMISVRSMDDAERMIAELPKRPSYAGIDRVQTIGMAVAEPMKEDRSMRISRLGVYRILPVGDMYLRSALEPYDGISLASLFTFMVYQREKEMDMGDVL